MCDLATGSITNCTPAPTPCTPTPTVPQRAASPSRIHPVAPRKPRSSARSAAGGEGDEGTPAEKGGSQPVFLCQPLCVHVRERVHVSVPAPVRERVHERARGAAASSLFQMQA